MNPSPNRRHSSSAQRSHVSRSLRNGSSTSRLFHKEPGEVSAMDCSEDELSFDEDRESKSLLSKDYHMKRLESKKRQVHLFHSKSKVDLTSNPIATGKEGSFSQRP